VPGKMADGRKGLHLAVQEDLRDRAKERLHADGRSMTQLVEYAFAEYLAGRLTLPPRTPPDDA
jgi:hypothetical protein